MISASIYEPKWLAKEQQEEKNQFATISYVAVSYSTISDSAIKVSNEEIEGYVNDHKTTFQQEPGRMISYVNFSAAPSAQDSARIRQLMLELKPQFASDSNPKFFLGRNASSIAFFDGYIPKDKIQVPNADSIISLPDGGVYGPYIDGKNLVLAKKIDTRILPDSIKCRHILLGTIDPQTQQPTIDDSTAHRIADSIQTAIANGASFDSLNLKYSTDQAAKAQNGVMTFDLQTIQGEGFAKEFADFLLNDNGVTKKVIKTQFGWHYIEILDKINPGPAYKIAYMAKEFAPSDQTINAANTAAIKLSGSANNVQSFNEYIQKNGLNKVDVPGIVKENDYKLGGLEDARSIVRWAFEAKEGAVSEPFTVKDDFVVAVVDKVIKEGTPAADVARPMVESIIRNQKKADQIKKKLNNPSTLEAAAAAYNVQVLTTGQDSTLTFDAQIINGIGNEPKVAGASFNKNYLTKVSPAFAGNTGVFVIKVNNISELPPLPAELLEQQKKADLSSKIQAALGQSFDALKKISDIKDMRSKFF